MNIKELVTYSFARNVGTRDRVFRVVSGAALSIAGWTVGAPLWASIALTFFGAGWALTGVVSRCGAYYLLGYSTCPHEPIQPMKESRP